MASKLEIEIELRIPAEKLWKNLREFRTTLPKALPNIYERIDLVEGDGTSVGSILVTTFKPSELNPVVSTTKERIDMMDEENKKMTYSYIEGEILKNYKNFKTTFCVSGNRNDGSLVKCLAEFDKANAQVPNPDFFGDFMVKVFNDWDAYLLKA